jgi:hypothetical protein
MRRVVALAVLSGILMTSAIPAWAGRSTDIALGLASFAVFNQVVAPMLRPRPAEAAYHRQHVVYHTVVTQPATVVTYPGVVVAHPTAVYTSPAPVVAAGPVQPTVVQYPHGRYELHWTGQQYVWVWVPTVPPVPAPPPAPAVPPAPAPPPAP